MTVLVRRIASAPSPVGRTLIRPVVPVALALIVLAALAARHLFVDEVSGDYRMFVGPWYDELAANGGFAARRDGYRQLQPALPVPVGGGHLPAATEDPCHQTHLGRLRRPAGRLRRT